MGSGGAGHDAVVAAAGAGAAGAGVVAGKHLGNVQPLSSIRSRSAPPRSSQGWLKGPAAGVQSGGRSRRDAPGRPETIVPTLPGAADGASTSGMPPVRKLPHYLWDVIAPGQEQGHKAKHLSPQLSDLGTVDHECSLSTRGCQAQPYVIGYSKGISVRVVCTGISPLWWPAGVLPGTSERPAITLTSEGAGLDTCAALNERCCDGTGDLPSAAPLPVSGRGAS